MVTVNIPGSRPLRIHKPLAFVIPMATTLSRSAEAETTTMASSKGCPSWVAVTLIVAPLLSGFAELLPHSIVISATPRQAATTRIRRTSELLLLGDPRFPARFNSAAAERMRPGLHNLEHILLPRVEGTSFWVSCKLLILRASEKSDRDRS